MQRQQCPFDGRNILGSSQSIQWYKFKNHILKFTEIASKYLTQDTFTSVHASFCWPGVNPKNIRCNPSLEPTGSLGDMAWYSCGVSLWVKSNQKKHKV